MIADTMLDLLLKSFKVQHRELDRDRALKAAENFPRWFAVELTYQNKPVRLIVAAQSLPAELSPAAPGATSPEKKPGGGPDQGALSAVKT